MPIRPNRGDEQAFETPGGEHGFKVAARSQCSFPSQTSKLSGKSIFRWLSMLSVWRRVKSPAVWVESRRQETHTSRAS
jgi:hypothetical protein